MAEFTCSAILANRFNSASLERDNRFERSIGMDLLVCPLHFDSYDKTTLCLGFINRNHHRIDKLEIFV